MCIGPIVLGAFLTFGLLKFVRHRRWAAYGCGPGYGHGLDCGPGGFDGGGCGGPWRGRWGHHHRGGGRWARRGWRGEGGPDLMWLALSRLDLTPGQEKAVRVEVDTLREKASQLKDETGKSRADIARAIRDDSFDETAVADMFVRHDDLLHDLRGDLAGALGRVHAVLDPSQRARLAELLERGPRAAGPYR